MYKRLKALLYLMQTRDFRELELELSTVKLLPAAESISEIIHAIERNDLKGASKLIESYLKNLNTESSENQIKLKDENDIAGLRTSSKLYEVQLSVLHIKKSEIVKTLSEFRMRHQEEVGAIMGEILRLRKEILWQKLIESRVDKSDFEDAKTDYQKYKKHLRAKPPAPPKLSNSQKKELHKIFREASKLCHPDVIAEESKEVANQVFAELNDAYFRNEINRVREIYEKLQNDEIHLIGISKKVCEKQKLQVVVARLANEIELLKSQIDEMRSSEAHRIINDIDDWDLYFENLRERFAHELEELKKEHSEVVP